VNQHFRNPRKAPNYPYDALGAGGSNVESVQPDETQFSILRQQFVGGMLPFECVIKLLQAKNSPPQVRQSVYQEYLTAVRKSVLLIPTNTKRLGFIIANPAASTIFFSYDVPFNVELVGVSVPSGIPIPAGGFFIESNGLASVNDIYVFSNDAALNYPAPIIGYEAVVTITPDNVV
jgi:hypothetical protein